LKEYTTLLDRAKSVARFIDLLARAYGLVQSFISLSIHHSRDICLQQILNMHHTFLKRPAILILRCRYELNIRLKVLVESVLSL
jgi:hypothetical protein